MKILYVTPDRDAAEAAVRALHGTAQNVALATAASPASAVQWLDGNPDAAAVVVAVPGESAWFVDRILPRIVGHAADRDRNRRHLLARALSEAEAEAAGRVARVEAKHNASLAREARLCTALQQRVFELESALRTAEERRTAEAGAFADQVAKRHAEFTASLTQTLQARDGLAIDLAAATAALDEAQEARAAERAAAAERLQRREAELGGALHEAGTACTILARALEKTEAEHRQAQARSDIELAAAVERQSALEDLLGQEADRRTGLEQRLAAAEAALEDARDRHTTELARAAARLADVQAQYDAAASEHASERASLQQQLVRTEAAAAEHVARREAEFASALVEAGIARATLERRLEERDAEYRDARERAEIELAQAAERQAALEDLLAQEADRRAGAERKLAAAEAALDDAVERHSAELERAADALAAATVRETELSTRLTGLRIETARRRRRLARALRVQRARGREQRRAVDAHVAELRGELTREREQRAEALRDAHEAHEAHERTRLTGAAEIQRVSTEYDHLRGSFDRLQTAFQTLEEIAGEHAAERARLEGVVATRDSELTAQAQRHRAAEQASQAAFAEAEAVLRQSLAASGADVARLEHERDTLRTALDASRAHADALRRDAALVPDLQMQLETSQKERRREFERAPYGLCHCTPEGVITDANHTFAAMLGVRRPDELRHVEFAAAVVDCAGDLGWLLERTRTVRRTESVETVWQTRDGRDLVVRLHAAATAAGSVEIVAEDVTRVRALEERLRLAQRMEAVGRLASEVAATCDALLGDVARGVREWATLSGGADALRQGDRLLTDVTRTASYLRQLGVYGDQQVRALAPVRVQRVLSDLAPVLKRVVGDRIALVLTKSSGAFDVDVEAERLERVLVNVAGYARQRMPHGGQMRIDVEATALGRRFVSRYPHVRPGHHVLITVTELPGIGGPRGFTAGEAVPLDRPGVELTALVDLVGTCGGHLWLEAQPAGNLVVKIHLPRRASAAGPERRAQNARSDRGGRLSRWFRAAPALRLRA
ncbi:MAG TPA: hypothetical protein VFK57_11640 [Vicinamibacterales bacterium]|nr:hypothetical protein [Vicinamibacterales bacterium]